MRIIYCDSVLDPKVIGPDYEEELQAARKAGFDFSLMSFEELAEGNLAKSLRHVRAAEHRTPSIYRGWMIMELGDGQVAGLPNHADKAKFYEDLAERIISA
ncbi:MAG: hypothetical protein AAFR87_14030 [Bacteroidota bacterium]